jgi:ABC-type glutathione transport system ATPase component
MGLMAQSVDDIAVLKRASWSNSARPGRSSKNPQHPYTKELISSVPLVGGDSFLDPEGIGHPGRTGADAAAGVECGVQTLWRRSRRCIR